MTLANKEVAQGEEGLIKGILVEGEAQALLKCIPPPVAIVGATAKCPLGPPGIARFCAAIVFRTAKVANDRDPAEILETEAGIQGKALCTMRFVATAGETVKCPLSPPGINLFFAAIVLPIKSQADSKIDPLKNPIFKIEKCTLPFVPTVGISAKFLLFPREVKPFTAMLVLAATPVLKEIR